MYLLSPSYDRNVYRARKDSSTCRNARSVAMFDIISLSLILHGSEFHPEESSSTFLRNPITCKPGYTASSANSQLFHCHSSVAFISESNRPILHQVSTQLSRFVVHVVSQFGWIWPFKLNLFIKSPITWMEIINKRENTECNGHALYGHLWPNPLYNIFPHNLINGTIF